MSSPAINAQLETFRQMPEVRLVLVVTDDDRGTIGAGFLRPDLTWRDLTAAQLALDRAQDRVAASDTDRLDTRKTFGDIQ